MPQAIHESLAFNSCNRKVAIHCAFSVKDNTLIGERFSYLVRLESGAVGSSLCESVPLTISRVATIISAKAR